MRRISLLALAAAALLVAGSSGTVLAGWGEHSETYSGEEMKSEGTMSEEMSPQAGTFEYEEALEAGSLPADPGNTVKTPGSTDENVIESGGLEFRPDVDVGP